MAEYDGIATATLHFDFTDQSEPDEQRRSVTPTPPAGSVTVTLTDLLRSPATNKVYVPESQKVNLSNGEATIRLFLNQDEDLAVQNTAYSVEINVNGKKYSRTIQLVAGMEDTTIEYADLPDVAPVGQYEGAVSGEAFASLVAQVIDHLQNHPGPGDTEAMATQEYVDGAVQGVLAIVGQHTDGEASDPHPNSRYAVMVDGPGRLIFLRETPDPLVDPLYELLGRELWFPESGS